MVASGGRDEGGLVTPHGAPERQRAAVISRVPQ